MRQQSPKARSSLKTEPQNRHKPPENHQRTAIRQLGNCQPPGERRRRGAPKLDKAVADPRRAKRDQKGWRIAGNEIFQ